MSGTQALALFLLGVYVAMSWLVARYAFERGRNGVTWGSIAILISPVLAAVLLAILKDRSAGDER